MLRLHPHPSKNRKLRRPDYFLSVRIRRVICVASVMTAIAHVAKTRFFVDLARSRVYAETSVAAFKLFSVVLAANTLSAILTPDSLPLRYCCRRFKASHSINSWSVMMNIFFKFSTICAPLTLQRGPPAHPQGLLHPTRWGGRMPQPPVGSYSMGYAPLS